MVSSFSLAVLLASTLLARADVAPNTPDTGKAGSQCTITWGGDSNSTSNWSNMAIEFMTGDNFQMVFLTTVATGLDGTKDGSYSWTCPQVTPYSPIYFYQFISPNEASNPQWTTRFAISSPTGETTPAPNATQSNGDKIPWGTGALVDASSASVAPSFAANATTGGSDVPTSSTSTSISVSVSSTASSSGSATTVLVLGNTSGAAGSHASVTGGSSSAASAAASSGLSSSNSNSGLSVDARTWSTAVGIVRLLCLIEFINALIWAHGAIDRFPIWCDISSQVMQCWVGYLLRLSVSVGDCTGLSPLRRHSVVVTTKNVQSMKTWTSTSIASAYPSDSSLFANGFPPSYVDAVHLQASELALSEPNSKDSTRRKLSWVSLPEFIVATSAHPCRPSSFSNPSLRILRVPQARSTLPQDRR
ncbi:hypothetical protein D9757_006657 [Collybiopsis confluens]|uniref:Yeast cell wall synthesis Kre9/Knh1-like N-terminal domain-containing protein n=1 Tax=Collybiopsis confluens TaxID=2823264 RepID=A0A8H5HN16_9AGAR|nr:hypothetical protein D9757_006657 [Collybiopsis confluens]